jgi:AcrR family transcriptional regulator
VKQPTLRIVSPASSRGVGRPRCEDSRVRILVAARELLEERGLRATTMEAIAERAGASKVTIYRWWSHKAAVVLDAMLDTTPRIESNEAVSPLLSLLAQMRSFARFLGSRRGRLLAQVVAEGVTDPEVGAAYREHWVKPRRDAARALLRRAIDAGELAPDIDIDATLDALFGPLYYRFLIQHAPLTREFAETIFRTVMSGIALPPPQRARAQGSSGK